MTDNGFTDEDLRKAQEYPVLGPTYFAAQRSVEALFEGAEAAHFKAHVNKTVDVIREALLNYVESWIVSDLQLNIATYIRQMLENTVHALLTGEPWALERYPLAKTQDGEKVRAAIAQYVGDAVIKRRVEELEADNARLRESLRR